MKHRNLTRRFNAGPAFITVLLITLFAFLCNPLLPAAWARSSINVPLDSWVYDALDRLEADGLIESSLSGTRPYSRLETARLLAEAIRKGGAISKTSSNVGGKDLIPSLVERLKKEFEPELIEWGVQEGTNVATYLKPIDEVIVRYAYQTEPPIVRPQEGTPPTHTISTVSNNDGIVYNDGDNMTVELQGEGRLWDHVSFYYRPIFESLGSEDAKLSLEKGYLKVEGANIELEIGRDSLWWGPGYNGGLLMTNNARPLDMVKLGNPLPFNVPLLGLFKFTVLVSRLGYDYGPPSIPDPLLYGMHLDFKPFPLFEIGLSQVAIFAGEGRDDLSIGDYFNILYGNKNRDGTKLDSNQQFSIDFQLRWPNLDRILPLARSLKFYGEWGAEDTGLPPDRRAYLLGLLLNDFFLTGRMDLRVEYTNTASKGAPTAWYRHGYYPPVYHERLFGHHVGSDGENLFARLTGYLSTRLLTGLDVTIEKQGVKEDGSTRSQQWGADVDYLIRDRTSIIGRYVLEQFSDSTPVAGGDKTTHLFALEFRQSF